LFAPKFGPCGLNPTRPSYPHRPSHAPP
jgi:hypothetical protein